MREYILKFVVAMIEKKGKLPKGADLEAFDYLEAGYIDSLGLTKFIVRIESEFGVEISDADIDSPRFRTIGGVVSLIEGKSKTSSPLFTILIPVYNAAAYLAGALDSVFAQTLPQNRFEVIVIDDCSTDGTSDMALQYANQRNFRMTRTSQNSGPGTARNVGIEIARGEWILFLDSDDRLVPSALTDLESEIRNRVSESVDAIGFNWTYLENGKFPQDLSQGKRKDHIYLTASREERLTRYLCLQTDGSAIYTCVRRDLLNRAGIRFEAGYHEDVDYIWFVYQNAREVTYVEKVLYGKAHRKDSIVNTMSDRHLSGFWRAWRRIGLSIASAETSLRNDFLRGVNGVVATRIREIGRLAPGKAESLYRTLYDGSVALLKELGWSVFVGSETKYDQMAGQFFEVMAKSDLSDSDKARKIYSFSQEILSKTWSCVDLHHSVFLAPNQIRTCCQRFFRNNQMQGDVVLMEAPAGEEVTSAAIVTAKKALIEAINKGESTACESCPFLEFKDWGPIDPFEIHYLSMEHHSICNLKCSYCSDTYYGGAKANYNVSGLVDDFLTRGQLDKCNTVVWGGGEPTLGENFTSMITKIVDRVPSARHHVLSNSVTYSETVANLLAGDKISVTTSVDAGCEGTFEQIRGRAKMGHVFANLQKYVSRQPRRVTVKYIFTEENTKIEEVQGFVDLVKRYQLNGCNFQISTNFKEEVISFDAAVLMIAMYGLLIAAGHRAVFFDDLLRHRLVDIHSKVGAKIRARLDSWGLASCVAQPKDYPRVLIWGAGRQAKYMVENSAFLKKAEIAFFVDNTASKIGTQYLGHDVRSPEALLENDLPVVIAAVQGYPIIYDKLLRIGVPESRLITSLIF
jgi:poly(ribitol-phosphate) beta-N-acetylglucosaminyltransferase